MAAKTTSKRTSVVAQPRALKTEEQYVTFWGVRGTLPTPGEDTLKYGGHTSCVEVSFRSKNKTDSIILDAGTGIVRCGDHALERGDRDFHVFLSHMHYDHIIGLTRFAPLFRDDCNVTFYGQAKYGKSLLEILSSFFSFPFFPVRFEDLSSRRRLNFIEVNGLDELSIGSARVQFQKLNHPQDAVAFRVWNKDQTTSVVYATDHEHGTALDHELEEFASNATLLLYDATYHELSYPQHRGWGHSTALAGAKIAKNSKVSSYGIFHHDPDANDVQLETKVLPEALRIFPRSFLTTEEHSVCLSKIANSPARTHIEDLLEPLEKAAREQTAPTRRLTRG